MYLESRPNNHIKVTRFRLLGRRYRGAPYVKRYIFNHEEKERQDS